MQFRREATQRVSFMIDADHVRTIEGGAADSRKLKAGEHYFRLWLSEMFLKFDRDWFAGWHPVVLSTIAFQFGDQQPEIVTRVAGAKDLKNVSKENLDKALGQGVDLTPLIPFNGGTVKITAALLAVQGGNEVEQLIGEVADFSKKFALAQLSGLLDVAGSLATRVAALVGAPNCMMTALDRTFSGAADAENVLRAGYLVAIAANEWELDRGNLWVKGGRLHYGDSFEESERLSGYSYTLFRLECADARDDFDSLSAIQEPASSTC